MNKLGGMMGQIGVDERSGSDMGMFGSMGDQYGLPGDHHMKRSKNAKMKIKDKAKLKDKGTDYDPKKPKKDK